MQVVLNIYVYYNDKLFGIFHSGFIISCLDGLVKHWPLYTAHSITCIMFEYNGQAFFWYSMMHILFLGEMIN